MAPENRVKDRRIQKTQALLHDALGTLIREKPYDEIVLKEILDRANVGRSTFYTHFRDKDELLVSGFENVRSLLESAQASAGEFPAQSYERIIGFSLAMFEHAHEYRAVNRALLGSSAEAAVRRQIHSALEGIIGREVKAAMHKRKRADCPVSPELLTHFLVSSYIFVLTWWMNGKNPVAPKDIDAAYRRLVLPCLVSVFG